jgi:O-antigen ligase
MTVATTAVGIGLCVFYFLAPKRWFQVISVSALSGVVILFMMIVKMIPGPEFISGIDSSGRDVLWRGAIEAWRQRPILGLGPGSNLDQLAPFIMGTGQEGSHVHNSYLRMLMSTGIVGFVAYVYFHIRTIWTGLEVIDDSTTAAAIVLVIVYSINQITNIFSLFGFTVTSVVISLSFGYVLREIVDMKIHQSEERN